MNEYNVPLPRFNQDGTVSHYSPAQPASESKPDLRPVPEFDSRVTFIAGPSNTFPAFHPNNNYAVTECVIGEPAGDPLELLCLVSGTFEDVVVEFYPYGSQTFYLVMADDGSLYSVNPKAIVS